METNSRISYISGTSESHRKPRGLISLLQVTEGGRKLTKIPSENFPAWPVFQLAVNIGFPIFITPFWIAKAKEKNQTSSPSSPELRSFYWHKLACVIVQIILVSVFVVHQGVKMSFSDFRERPETFFEMLLLACTTGYILAYYFIYWFRQRQIEDSLKSMVLPSGPRGNNRKKNAIPCILLILQFSTIITLLSFSEGQTKDFAAWISQASDSEFGSLLNKFLVLLLIISLTHNMIASAIAAALPLHLAIFAYRVADSYELEVGSVVKTSEKIRLYKEAKKKIGLINSAFSILVLISLARFIVFTALHIGRSNSCGNFYCILGVGIYIFDMGTFLMAAEARFKMNVMEKDVISSASNSNGNSQISPAEVAATLRTAEGGGGLRGWRFFEVSYSFMGSVLSVCMTYGLVVLQFSSSSASSFGQQPQNQNNNGSSCN